MLYFQLKAEDLIIGLPKRQTSGNRGAQNLWIPTISWDSQVAEETAVNSNPKVLPLGFFIGEKMRPPREYKEETVYYVTVRASSRELLFRDEEDYNNFLEIIKTRKEKYNFKLYAYCLLPQHYHLLLEPAQSENLSKIMQAINTSYSLYFNKKYNRSGHLISGRFISKLFNKDERLLHQSIYLHLNPVRLGLTQKSEDYKWSSYSEYTNASGQGITGKDYILSFMRGTHPANREGVPCGDSLGFGSMGVPEKYRQAVEELELVRTPGVEAAEKNILKKVGYGVLVAGLLGALIIAPQLLMHKPGPDTLSDNITKGAEVNFPEGLPFYSGAKIQKEARAWEVWKLGPFNH